jgi:hypothetical protein
VTIRRPKQPETVGERASKAEIRRLGFAPMSGAEAVTAVGGFVVGVVAGGFGVWQVIRQSHESPSILLTVRTTGTAGEFVLVNSGFRPAWAVTVELHARATHAAVEVVARNNWRQVNERSEVTFHADLASIAGAPREAVITWYSKARGGKPQRKTVLVQRAGS